MLLHNIVTLGVSLSLMAVTAWGNEDCPNAWLFAFQRNSNLLELQKDHAKTMLSMMQVEDGMLVDDSIAIVSYGGSAEWALEFGSQNTANVSVILSLIDELRMAQGKAQNYAAFFELVQEPSPSAPGGETAYTIVLYSNGGDAGGSQRNHNIFRNTFIENYGLRSDQLTFDCVQSQRQPDQRPPIWRKTDLCKNRAELIGEPQRLRRLDDVSQEVNSSAAFLLEATECPTPTPTISPTMSPTTPEPTMSPSFTPTESPSIAVPTMSPSFTPTASPVPTTLAPTTIIFSLATPCPKRWILAFETSTSLLSTQKTHALGLLDRMPVNDEGNFVYSEVSIVRYSGQARYVVSFETPDSRNKEALQDAINDISRTQSGRNYNRLFRLLEAPNGAGATFLPSGTDEVYTVVLYSSGGKGQGVSSRAVNTHNSFVSNFLTNYNIARDQFFFDCVLAKNRPQVQRTLFQGTGLCDNRNTVSASEEVEVIEDKASVLFDMTTCPTEAPTQTPTVSPTATPTTEKSVFPDQPTQQPTDDKSVFPIQPTQAPTTEKSIFPDQPTQEPTTEQSIFPEQPTQEPTTEQSIFPEQPTQEPTTEQSIFPEQPTQEPTTEQSIFPEQPTQQPTIQQSIFPEQPTQQPTIQQSIFPEQPTQQPTIQQSIFPEQPTQQPTEQSILEQPTNQPTIQLSIFPGKPTQQPTTRPTPFLNIFVLPPPLG